MIVEEGSVTGRRTEVELIGEEVGGAGRAHLFTILACAGGNTTDLGVFCVLRADLCIR